MKYRNISANIDEDLAFKLEKIAEFEGRSKSYYIKKGLCNILDEKYQDMQDLASAKETMDDVEKNNEELISFEEVFKNTK